MSLTPVLAFSILWNIFIPRIVYGVIVFCAAAHSILVLFAI